VPDAIAVWSILPVQCSVFGQLFHVIDDQNFKWKLLSVESQAELLSNHRKQRRAAGVVLRNGFRVAA